MVQGRGAYSRSRLRTLPRSLGWESGFVPGRALGRHEHLAENLHPEEGRSGALTFSQSRRGSHQDDFHHAHQRASFQGAGNVLLLTWVLSHRCHNRVRVLRLYV